MNPNDLIRALLDTDIDSKRVIARTPYGEYDVAEVWQDAALVVLTLEVSE